MSKARRFMRLPPDWERLKDEELERLCDRADRVQGILPELPPLEGSGSGSRREAAQDDDGERIERKARPRGVDRETLIEQQDERAD